MYPVCTQFKAGFWSVYYSNKQLAFVNIGESIDNDKHTNIVIPNPKTIFHIWLDELMNLMLPR